MFQSFRNRRKQAANAKGFTLIELMVVVAIIGILGTIAFPLYGSVQARPRMAKAQADMRAIASAVSIYSAHMGVNPGSLANLTSAVTNAQGQSAGAVSRGRPGPADGMDGLCIHDQRRQHVLGDRDRRQHHDHGPLIPGRRRRCAEHRGARPLRSRSTR
jgi:prepilin-type N-terminal cleavage/methylation domain-containing protein